MKLNSDALAVLFASGRLRPVTKTELILKAFKVDDTRLPPFWPEVSLLAVSLRKAWMKASKELGKLFDEVITVDADTAEFHADAWEKAHKSYHEVGDQFAKEIAPKALKISGLILTKSKKAFNKQLAKVKADPVSASRWDSWLQQASANHIEEFARSYPGRILHPQIERQLTEIAAAPDKHSTMDMFRMKERLNRIYNSDPYFDNLPAIEVSRLWHATGIMMANEKGIAAYQIVNPMDDRTCPVCLRLHGQVYDVSEVLPKVREWGSGRNPDEIASLFPFPRMDDVARDANPTLEDLKARGFNLPPFHGRCRDEIHYLWRDKPVEVPEQLAPVVEPPTTEIPLPKGWDIGKDGYVSINAPMLSKKEMIAALKKQGIITNNAQLNLNDFSEDMLNKAFGMMLNVSEHAPLTRKLKVLELRPEKNRGGFFANRHWKKNAREKHTDTIVVNSQSQYYIPHDHERTSTAVEDARASIKLWEEVIAQRAELTPEKIRKAMERNYWGDNPETDKEFQALVQQEISGAEASVKQAQNWLKEAQTKLQDAIERFGEEGGTIRSRIPLDVNPGEKLDIGLSVGDTSVQKVAVHEYGHAWHACHEEVVATFFAANQKGSGRDLSEVGLNNILKCQNVDSAKRGQARQRFDHLAVTKYAQKDLAETFAEAFAYYMYGQVKVLDPAFVKFFDSQFTNLAFGRRLIPEIYNES